MKNLGSATGGLQVVRVWDPPFSGECWCFRYCGLRHREARPRDGGAGGRGGRFMEDADKFTLGYAEFQVPVGKISSRWMGMWDRSRSWRGGL